LIILLFISLTIFSEVEDREGPFNYQGVDCILCPEGIGEYLLECGHQCCLKCLKKHLDTPSPCPKDGKVSEAFMKLKKR